MKSEELTRFALHDGSSSYHHLQNGSCISVNCFNKICICKSLVIPCEDLSLAQKQHNGCILILMGPELYCIALVFCIGFKASNAVKLFYFPSKVLDNYYIKPPNKQLPEAFL